MTTLDRTEDFENIYSKCGRMNTEHPATGRFSTIVLFGDECAWSPDNEFKNFVVGTLKRSGYNLQDFGFE